jgi:hypothetical protein
MPGISRNCRRTSSIILYAALETESMVIAEKAKGSMPPVKRPITTFGVRMSMELSLTSCA